VVDVRIRRADLPEQNSQAVYQRMQTERQREAAEFRAKGSQRAGDPVQGRPRRDRARRRGHLDRRAGARRGRRRAQPHLRRSLGKDPDFFAFYRSMQAYETGLRTTTPASCCGRIRTSSAHVLETADGPLRVVGIVSAVLGVILVWFVRG
jgi:membrane protease subunit HflC